MGPIILLGPVVLGLGLYFKVHEPVLGWFTNRHHAEALLAAVAYGLVGLFRRNCSRTHLGGEGSVIADGP